MSTKDSEPELLRVLREDGRLAASAAVLPPAEIVLAMYREMRRVRLLDAKMVGLQRQGRIGFYGACLGQEAVPIATALAIDPEDWIFPALRESSVMLVRGFPLARYLAQVIGTSEDPAKGRQMPSHQSARAVGVVSWSSCIGTQLPHAVGVAWAQRKCGDGRMTVAFLGDGATSTGDFHAALNFAGVFRVPCVFVCQNNHWAISTPGSAQTASSTLAVKARAYGLPGVRVDGNDALAVYDVVREAHGRAKAGLGATFIECLTYRMGAHSTSDDPSAYRSEEEVARWALRDPVRRLGEYLRHAGLMDDAEDGRLEAALSAEIDEAWRVAEAAAPPSVPTLFEDVFAEAPWHLREQARGGSE